MTCANTLDKGLNVLESAQGNSDVNAHFDVALVEEEQVAPIMRDVMNGTNSSPLFGRFTTIAKEVAIVLMHEDEDVASKTYMIEAIKVGVVDVVSVVVASVVVDVVVASVVVVVFTVVASCWMICLETLRVNRSIVEYNYFEALGIMLCTPTVDVAPQGTQIL